MTCGIGGASGCIALSRQLPPGRFGCVALELLGLARIEKLRRRPRAGGSPNSSVQEAIRARVVFSFFKKDPKDSRKRPVGASADARGKRADQADGMAARPAPAMKPAGAPATPREREQARSIAMETAAKIDAIENEMARDFLRTTIRDTGGPAVPSTRPAFDPSLIETTSPPRAQPARPAAKPVPATDTPVPLGETEEFDPGADVLESSVDAIEINTSGAGSIIDETAILFSNGQIDAAEAVLRAGIRADDLAHATQNAWLMLFELTNQRGDRKAFDQLTMEYALRFENSPPAWFDYLDAPAGSAGRRPAPAATAAVAASAEPVVSLPERIDAGVVQHLEQLKKVAATHAALALDFSAVRSIDLVGAELLLRVVNAFKRARHELTLIGVERFLGPLRSATEPGRRDASDALWMLLLEVLRVLDRQEEFDETAIQYCITFEVSPPSWEPPLPNIKAAPPSAQDLAAAVEAPSVDRFEWHGVIEGEGEPYFGRVLAAAPKSPQLIVDCEQLRRMAFSAASALLSLARRVQRMGSSLELRNVNPLVGALLHLLGVTGAATVHLRRG